MGALKTLGEYWSLGKRTFQEVGVIAREVLSLVDQTEQDDRQEVQRFQFIAPMESPPAIFPTPDNSPDFSDLYNFNFDEAIKLMSMSELM